MSQSLGELRRVLGPLAGIAVSVGVAVGAGILRAPGEVAAALPSVPWLFAAWLLGALVAVLDGLVLAEMASSVPRVGGLVAYVRLSFGPAAAFVVGWSMLLVSWPASLAVVAVVVGDLVVGGATTLRGDGAASVAGRAVAVAVIAASALLNWFGLRTGARAEIALLVLKVVLLAGVCIAALVAVASGSTAPVEVAAAPALPATMGALLAAVGGAMIGVHFTYDGYADVVYLAGETRDPGRSLPRALFLALLIITSLYLLANAAFVAVLGVPKLARSSFPALDVVQIAFGDAGAVVLAVVAIVVMLGAVNAYFLTGPRIARVLAEDGLAMQAFGRMDDRSASRVSLVWIFVLGSLYSLTGTFDDLLAVVVPTISATTILVAIGLLVQRVRAPERPRPFRTPWAPLVVVLQVGLSLFLLTGFAVKMPRAVAIDAAAVVVGLAVYFVVRRRR